MGDSAAKIDGYKYVILPLYDSPAREQLVSEVYISTDSFISASQWKLSATSLMIATISDRF